MNFSNLFLEQFYIDNSFLSKIMQMKLRLQEEKLLIEEMLCKGI